MRRGNKLGANADVTGQWKLYQPPEVTLAHCANAFGTISRKRMLDAVVETLPGLARFVHMAYSKPGRVILANRRAGADEEHFKTFLSKTGVRQGDPLGPLLYALTAATAMLEVQEHYAAKEQEAPIALMYADDTNGLLSAADGDTLKPAADEWLQALEAAFLKIGVKLNPSLLSIFSRQNLGFDELDCGIRVERDGTKVLGVPIGSREYTQAKAEKRLKASYTIMERIPELETATAVKLLRLCVNQRPTFLARTMPTAYFEELAVEWDEKVDICLTQESS